MHARLAATSRVLIAVTLLCPAMWAQAPDPSTCTTTNLFAPGAAGTISLAVNRFDTVVGEYLDDASFQVFAFHWNGGHFINYQFPDSRSTLFNGVNDSGLVVGAYESPAHFVHAITWKSGTVTRIDKPGAADTRAMGINNSGTIVGAFRNKHKGPFHGFVKMGSSWTQLDFPGSTFTEANAISDTGVVVGDFSDGKQTHGFTYFNGKWAQVDFPGAISTSVTGINRYGSLVGSMLPNKNSGNRGWGFRGGKFYRAPVGDLLQGINNLGDRVGATTLPDNTQPGTLIVCR